MLECVVNLSEGTQSSRLDALRDSCDAALLDLHRDRWHNRSVFTLAGTTGDVMSAARELAAKVVATVDISAHEGAHPRIGALDVVPWVTLQGWPVADGDLRQSIILRDRFARWAAEELRLPCFVYGPERSLPEIRRHAWNPLEPEYGPGAPHPSAGAAAVGARPVLVAYNIWLAEPDLLLARSVAAALRGLSLRALGLRVGSDVQVSFNLIDPWRVGPGAVFDAVASRAAVARAELVGLIPDGVLRREPSHRYRELGLDPSSTIEARLEQAGLDGGRFGPHSC